ncbi:tyrosine-protein kinase transmembrane receptor Ror-like [Tigriopus californicus]|uniref:tyrosine-protein kinase transmembrane receptor Ror-like n=1 Tax=Tigriopus californicus TaxID=6832 RepID=UPI0027DA5C4A|nr:tyrosine-protein kinase transmembrane receptor Ror-like [Tigriopus californicus]XP_059082577.1 tyrosine-protein kinase transmembrane receptor Ror-like [Tigriopus californicus]
MRARVLWVVGGILCLIHNGICQDNNEEKGEEESATFPTSQGTPGSPQRGAVIANRDQSRSSLVFLKDLRNLTKEAGDFLRLRCEVTGQPPVATFEWLKNGIPLIEEKNRMKVKTKLKDNPQWTQLRIKALETLDMAFYACQASNGYDTITSTAIVKVQLGKVDLGRRPPWQEEDEDDYDEIGLLPETYKDPDLFSSGKVEFEGGQQPPNLNGGTRSKGNRFDGNRGSSANAVGSSIPILKPNERAGNCQPYVGTVCAKYIQQEYVFVSAGLSQTYVEQKLQAAFSVITMSPDLSSDCSPYAVPSICLATFPLCDRHTEKPRKLCREECELLENRVCRKELALARQYAALERQLVLPECQELPPLGSPSAANCVRLGIPEASQLIRPHSCYAGKDGREYRGTMSTTESGLTCQPWNRQIALRIHDHMELTGGHNYCRNPEGSESMSEPWCYAGMDKTFKEVCGIPKCNTFNVYLYIAVPALIAVATLGLCIGLCCMRRTNDRKTSKAAPDVASNRNGMRQTPNTHSGAPSNGTLQTQQSGNMEMNSLLPPHQQQQQQPQEPTRGVRAREFPLSSVRFMQELGEGAFGKVYQGELHGVATSGPQLVAIKTLKPGANQKTRSDFQREAELMAELRHPNIVCLLGVSFQEDPQCMLFEHMAHGDLHEFLITHSPNVDSDVSDPAEDQNVLNPMDMSFIAIQIAAGMEYLASHHYVHRDLAARNCLVGENLTVKISDFGLSRDIYAADYYRVQSKSLLPVRWMPPESILYGKFTTDSDVWAFGVVLWEIYSYGLQPYYGYSNQEVIEMIRSRQLLPCPEDCPSRMYAFMVECWHEVPSRRPHFAEIHSRLRHWEGYGSGGYQPSTTSQSMGNQSQHSGSHHSSNTGPNSNNTNSTNLSNNHFMYRGGGPGPPPPGHHPHYMSHIQTGPHGGPPTMLLGSTYGGPSAVYPPHAQHGPKSVASTSSQNSQSNCQTPASVASLQMV